MYTAARTENRAGLKQLWLVLGATFLIALSGQISIPLPFTPVPLTLQVHVCLLMAALLGRRLGTLSVAFFLLLGAMGLPVFSMGGAGWPILLGPRGGYLVGYLAGAWMTGTLIRPSSTARFKALAMGVGNLVVYACGLPQLALFVGAERVFMLGMLPFLAGDLIKLFISYRLVSRSSEVSEL